jgi:tetratricopeptide (TPR) repeat protein
VWQVETVDINGLNGKSRQIIIGLLLAAAVLAVYWPVTGYDFIALDDNLYVIENQHIQKGITCNGIAWAMTTLYATNWHPLTWLSLMADYELYGLNVAGYHGTSLFLHILNVIFLFLLLRRMTGKEGRSAVVATLFAVHPLNIESVVWIAERKNLLSTLFWIMTILAYVRYAEKPKWGRYWPVLLLFALGLMAKPILVTLPFVLLLLDYWPLQRFSLFGMDRSGVSHDHEDRRKFLIRLLLEKAPLILVSLLSAWITFHAARVGGAVKAISVFPLVGRIENAVISYAMYLVKMVWPADLAIFYPYPSVRPFWQVALSILFFAAATGFVCLKGRTYRYLITAWFWYGITLFPVIGIVQVGFQSMANRYAYISLIGIFIIVTWGVPDLLKRFSQRWYLPAVSVAVILAFAVCTKSALPDWKNSEMAFRQALNVTKNNHIAEMGMGNVWLGRGDLPKARSYYLESLLIKHDYAEAHNNLAIVLMQEGKADEAADQYQEALKDKPDYAEAYNNLGVVFAGQGKSREAEEGFRRALELNLDYAGAQSNLAKLLREEGRLEEAVEYFRAALAIDPDNKERKKDFEETLKQLPSTQNDRLKGQ